MTNPFYAPSGTPATKATGASSPIRAEFALVEAGFDDVLGKDGSVTATANLPMGGFKHTGAAAATASGQYLVYDQDDAKLTRAGFGVAPSPWGATDYSLDLGEGAAVAWQDSQNAARFTRNSYWDGSDWRAKFTGGAVHVDMGAFGVNLSTADSVPADDVQTIVIRARFDTTGPEMWLPTSAKSLTTNSHMTFTLTSNTNLRFSVRGSDGTTRVANITLA
jgi:hypothetical protein